MDTNTIDITGANLKEADLTGADLKDADLSNTEAKRLGDIFNKAFNLLFNKE